MAWRTALTLALGLTAASVESAETVVLWLFDEQAGLYPSSPLDSSGGLDAPLVLGFGGTIVPGKFGEALSTEPYPRVEIPKTGEETAALHRAPVPPGRTQEPLTWHNAGFTALMTGGERHIRKEVSFASATRTDLNLGDFDWTLEFWLKASAPRGRGVVLEIGTGPRNENESVTRLSLDLARSEFLLENQPSGTRTTLRTTARADDQWHHQAFTYRGGASELSHYVDGRRESTARVALKRLPAGDEDYLTLGRDGRWQQPLPGTLDEVRVSRGLVYSENFDVPPSFAPVRPQPRLIAWCPNRRRFRLPNGRARCRAPR